MIADHEIDVPPVGHLFLQGADDDSVSLPAVVDGVDEKVVQRLEQQSEKEEGKVRGNASRHDRASAVRLTAGRVQHVVNQRGNINLLHGRGLGRLGPAACDGVGKGTSSTAEASRLDSRQTMSP